MDRALTLLSPHCGVQNYETLLPVVRFLRNSITVYNRTQAEIDTANAMTNNPTAAAEKLLKALRRRTFWMHRAAALLGAPVMRFRNPLAWRFILLLDIEHEADPDGEFVPPPDNANLETQEKHRAMVTAREFTALDRATEFINRAIVAHNPES